jgi:hypothetical protein
MDSRLRGNDSQGEMDSRLRGNDKLGGVRDHSQGTRAMTSNQNNPPKKTRRPYKTGGGLVWALAPDAAGCSARAGHFHVHAAVGLQAGDELAA